MQPNKPSSAAHKPCQAHRPFHAAGTLGCVHGEGAWQSDQQSTLFCPPPAAHPLGCVLDECGIARGIHQSQVQRHLELLEPQGLEHLLVVHRRQAGSDLRPAGREQGGGAQTVHRTGGTELAPSIALDTEQVSPQNNGAAGQGFFMLAVCWASAAPHPRLPLLACTSLDIRKWTACLTVAKWPIRYGMTSSQASGVPGFLALRAGHGEVWRARGGLL